VADFKTHITTSSFLGVAYGVAARGLFDVPLSTCVLAGGLCGVSGMLPDVDSNSSKPLKESLAFGGAVVAMMTADRFAQLGMKPEWIVLCGAAVYLFVRFVVGGFLRRYTVHRGMFHSLPAAVIFGEVAFLLASGTDVRIRAYKAGAVVIGYVSHLVLDELYSLEWRRGRPRLKKSFGTALKMFSRSWWATASTYLKLGLLTYVVLYEPGWMEQVRQQRPLDWAHNWVQQQTGQPADDPAGQAADAAIADSVEGQSRDERWVPNRSVAPSSDPLFDPVAPRTADERNRYLR
jgi:membrane-bound metal-dependent hydrolase YbcI (DUF457 family)